jgi:outer membrane PBP1 activator LpoA protein
MAVNVAWVIVRDALPRGLGRAAIVIAVALGLGLALAGCGNSNLTNPLTSTASIESPATPPAQGMAAAGTPAPATTVQQAETRIAEASAERVRQQGGIKVAVLLPLTGKGKSTEVANALKQAGELAMFDLNNPDIVLTAKDTKGTPEGARAAAEEAVQSGAELIIGPLFAKDVSAAAPVAQKAGVPMIALSSDQKVAGNGVYLLSFLAGQDVDRIVTYTIASGKRRFAGLVPDTPYGQIVEASFRDAVARHGGELVALERFPEGDPNAMLGPTEKIAELARTKTPKTKEQPEQLPVEPKIDALFIPAGAETMPTLAPILPYFEIDTEAVKVIGTGNWDYAEIGKEASLVKGWYPGPDPEGWRKFTERYAATYGAAPPRIASLAYDAVSLAVSLSKLPRGERYSAAQLTRPSGFAGVDGLFRLKGDGTCERGLAVLEVQKFGPRVIDPAPAVFVEPVETTASATPAGGAALPRF